MVKSTGMTMKDIVNHLPAESKDLPIVNRKIETKRFFPSALRVKLATNILLLDF